MCVYLLLDNFCTTGHDSYPYWGRGGGEEELSFALPWKCKYTPADKTQYIRSYSRVNLWLQVIDP